MVRHFASLKWPPLPQRQTMLHPRAAHPRLHKPRGNVGENHLPMRANMIGMRMAHEYPLPPFLGGVGIKPKPPSRKKYSATHITNRQRRHPQNTNASPQFCTVDFRANKSRLNRKRAMGMLDAT